MLDGVCVSTEISQLGEKYVDKEIENAIQGVKEMKTVMEKSEEDHQKFLTSLEETKNKKEVREIFQTDLRTGRFQKCGKPPDFLCVLERSEGRSGDGGEAERGGVGV